MQLKTQPYKGARDFYPEDKRVQKYMFAKMREVCERFGYEEYDAPILEPEELYLAKSSDEIVSEQTYVFTDRGDRRVVIRPEMTPTVSRMVAGRRQELAYPVRWYSIPNLWRYERPQRGRLREHWQLNVDIFGVAGLEAELEMIQIVDGILKSFGAKSKMYTVKLNSRILVNYLMNSVLGLDETAAQTLIRLIDRMHKMSEAEFYGQVELVMGPGKRDSNEYRLLLDFLKVTSVDSLAPELQQSDTVQRLKKLVDMLSDVSIHNVVFDPTLMRGFDYYTDIVFEVFDNNPDNNRSMFGGGRYDGLVGMFGVEPVPTVGFGMGDVTLQNFLESNNLIPNLRPETELYIAIIGEAQTKAHKVIKELREMHMNVFVDYTGRKVDKQLKSALKKSSKYIVFIGDNELKSEQYVLRNLDTGKEEAHSLQRIVSIIKDHRNS